MFSSKELICGAVNIMAKCFDEDHLGPLSQRKAKGKKTKKQKQLPSVSLKSNRPNSAQRACSTGYPKLPAGPQPANHLLNSASRQNAVQYCSTSEEGAVYIPNYFSEKCMHCENCLKGKMIMNKSVLSGMEQDEISMKLPVCVLIDGL